MQYFRFALLFVYLVVSLKSNEIKLMWDYIIIGAGPAGLQMGYLLEKNNRDYIIFERNLEAGSFFRTFPRHDRLISINKKFTGRRNKEFNLRHDWNSLLSDDSLPFYQFSNDFFPYKSEMRNYLNVFSKNYKLNILFGKEVSNISKIQDHFHLSINDQVYKCNKLIMATGMNKPILPDFKGSQHMLGYEEIPLEEDFYKGKDVLILGHGNSAFETANAIYGKTNKVHILGRSRVRLAWETHYVGDLRSVYSELIDTYQLKSLDGILEGRINEFNLVKYNNKLYFDAGNLPDSMDNFALREGYDIVIRCLGFEFNDSIFSSDTKPKRHQQKKYPEIDYNFQSTNIEDLYFIGTSAHSLDYRKSSGGFIHGFRYMIQTFYQTLEWTKHHIPWPSTVYKLTELVNVILKRINEVSSLYQMHGVLGDVIAFRREKVSFEYYKDFQLANLHDFEHLTGHKVKDVLVIMLNYGKSFSKPGNDVLRIDRATGVLEEAHHSNFLHPQFFYYKKLPTKGRMFNKKKEEVIPNPDRAHYILEDFHTTWTSPTTHVLPLRRFLENCTQSDLRHFKSSDCLLSSFIDGNLPLDCSNYLYDSYIL